MFTYPRVVAANASSCWENPVGRPYRSVGWPAYRSSVVYAQKAAGAPDSNLNMMCMICMICMMCMSFKAKKVPEFI